MKKLIFTLLACFAIVQSTQAATSGLTESLLEYEAITTALGTNPNFENVIPVTEFIIDIARKSSIKSITEPTTVKYNIVTRVLSETDFTTSIEQGDHDASSHHHCHHHMTNTYLAVLTVSPNPAIGPNIITVDSITRTHSSRHTTFLDESN